MQLIPIPNPITNPNPIPNPGAVRSSELSPAIKQWLDDNKMPCTKACI